MGGGGNGTEKIFGPIPIIRPYMNPSQGFGNNEVLWKEVGRGSLVGSVSAWHASGPEFDSHVRHILPWTFGHEIISIAILPLPLIQGEQLSVTGERVCTKYWQTA